MKHCASIASETATLTEADLSDLHHQVAFELFSRGVTDPDITFLVHMVVPGDGPVAGAPSPSSRRDPHRLRENLSTSELRAAFSVLGKERRARAKGWTSALAALVARAISMPRQNQANLPEASSSESPTSP